MSGFVGILNLDGAPVDRYVLRRMTESMAISGPDAQETWCEGAVGLGHAMLRTTWESATERQPATLDGRLRIVADARIDAREELVQELTAKSIPGRAISIATPDSELILCAYEVWGDSCVEHLLGDFSFAIWDAPKRSLFCARDHFGIKTLYYARIGNAFVFSNSLDAIRLFPGFSPVLCDAAIADFLVFAMNLHLERTPFEDILRLPRAHTLVASADEVRTERYWSFPIEEPLRYRRSREYVDHFRELLHLAVKDRLRCDRASISLSGGLDSPTVAAEAAKQLGSPENLLGMTTGFEHFFPDPEPRFARVVAEHLKIPWHFVAMDAYKPFQRWESPELCRSWPADITMGAVNSDFMERVASHSRVLLTGEGGDPGLVPSLNSYRGMGVFRLAVGVGKYIMNYGHHPRLGFRVAWRRWRGMPHVAPQRFPEWLDPELDARLGLRDRWHEMLKESASDHPFRPGSHAGLSGPWLGFFGTDESCCRNVPVETRHPLFDVRILRFFLRLPVLPWCADKEILRLAMRDSVPDTILRRPKSPVQGVPIATLLKGSKPSILRELSASAELSRFVVRGRIPEVDPSDPRLDLRPASLSYWLSHNLG